MKELAGNLNQLFVDFAKDAELNVNGNRAAGQRTRKVSLEIEKALKNSEKCQWLTQRNNHDSSYIEKGYSLPE
jgi:hypothetical protein